METTIDLAYLRGDAVVIVALHIFSSVGIELQCTDSRIAERVIGDFVARDIPLLPVHDSFVIGQEHYRDLFDSMNAQFCQIVREGVGMDVDASIMIEAKGRNAPTINDLLRKENLAARGVDYRDRIELVESDFVTEGIGLDDVALANAKARKKDNN